MQSRDEILQAMQTCCREVFDAPDLMITVDTRADDVEGWDSLSHLRLIDRIQKAYGIKLSLSEILGMKNVGDLIRAVEKHQES